MAAIGRTWGATPVARFHWLPGSPEELAQEFEPTAQSIRNWVGQAECDAGRGGNGIGETPRLVQDWAAKLVQLAESATP
jgi:transposase-like protein